MRKMYEFKTAQFSITWAIEPDSDCDLSFDDTGETREKIESGEWECFTSRMQCRHRQTGAVLATDYLGGSIYANPADFRDHIGARGKYGSYFRDMVRNVCAEAREQLRALNGVYARA